MKIAGSDMKIALLITGLGRGGAETQLVRLACALAERGWDICVLTLLPPTQFTDVLARSGVSVWTAGMRRFWDAPRALWRLIAKLRCWRPHVLLGFMFHADLLGRIAARGAGIPVVISSVRSINMGGRHREWALRLTSGLARAVTANSQMTIQHLVARGVAGTGRLLVIPNGIDLDRFQRSTSVASAVRTELDAEPEDFVWLAIGRFEPPKDYPNLLRAFAHVVSTRPAACLWIAGDGPLREKMEELAGDLEVTSRCRFLGLRDDVPRLLAGANAVVQASAWEGLPNSVLEALASRRPVVATNVGGTSELIEDGTSGLLVPPKAPLVLGRAMVELMELPLPQRAAMGTAGQEHIAATFTMERVVVQWEDLFLELLAEAGYASEVAHA